MSVFPRDAVVVAGSVGALMLGTLFPATSAAQPFSIESVTAQPPLGLGSSWATLHHFGIDEQRRIFITGTVQGPGVESGNDRGLWAGKIGQLAPIARESTQVVGGPAGRLWAQDQFFFPSLMYGDCMSFTARYQNPDGTTEGGNFIVDPAGQHTLAVRQGDPAPGTAPGVVLAFASPVLPATADGQAYAFLNTLAGPGVTSSNDNGIWASTAGATQLVARKESQAPGAPAGATFSFLSYPNMNTAGQMIFRAGLNIGTGGVSTTNDSGYWFHNGGTTALAVREGKGLGGGLFVGSIPGTTRRLNPSGHFAFDAGLRGAVTASSDTAIFKQAGTATSIVAREGSAAPGGGVFTTLFTNSSFTTDDGDVVFFGETTGSVRGIFVGDGSTLTRVIGQDSAVPGKPGATFSTIFSPTVSVTGQVAYIADLTIAGTPSPRHLFATDPQGVVQYIAGPGTILETSPGITQEVLRASLYSTDFQDVEQSQFNGLGQLVFRADFVGGGSGVFLATVPEPAAATLVALLAPAMLLGRRRGRQRS